MESLRAQRARGNRALARKAKANIANRADRPEIEAGEPVFVCECADRDCDERLPNVALMLYDQIKENPRRFLVALGHHQGETERVIERRPNFLIVEDAKASRIAEESPHRAA